MVAQEDVAVPSCNPGELLMRAHRRSLLEEHEVTPKATSREGRLAACPGSLVKRRHVTCFRLCLPVLWHSYIKMASPKAAVCGQKSAGMVTP